jgi:hypothetical protein
MFSVTAILCIEICDADFELALAVAQLVEALR